MPSKKIRVGVIGVGRMGERHCRVYSGLAGVDFVGVNDTSIERGQTVAHRYGVRFFDRVTDLLAEVDAISVTTPTDSHAVIAAECLQRHVHILVEKPLANNLAEAHELVQLARRSDVVLQAGHIERFNPAFLELESILEGETIVGLSARRLSPFDTSNTDIDVVFDLMIHDIDLALTLMRGDIALVQASGCSARTSATDYAVASLGMANGAVATLTASRVTEQKVRTLEITALGAYVEVDLLNMSISIFRRTLPEYLANRERPLRYRQEGLVERIHIPTAEPLWLELQDFVRCVQDGSRPRVSGEDGLRALELATRIQEQVYRQNLAAPALVAMT